ncbi:MAG: hypothetical protein ACPGJS_18325 [Flammeovirgaceae bacterium]
MDVPEIKQLSKLLEEIQQASKVDAITHNHEHYSMLHALKQAIHHRQSAHQQSQNPVDTAAQTDHEANGEEVTALKSKCAQLLERCESNEEVAKMTINYLIQKLQTITEEKKTVEIRYEEKQQEIIQFADKLSAIEELQQVIHQMHDKLSTWHQSTEALVSSQEQLLTQKNDEESAASQEVIQSLQEQLEQKQEQLEQQLVAHKELTELAQDTEKHTHAIDELSQEREQLLAQIEALQYSQSEQLTQHQAQVDELEKKLAAITTENSNLTNQLTMLATQPNGLADQNTKEQVAQEVVIDPEVFLLLSTEHAELKASYEALKAKQVVAKPKDGGSDEALTTSLDFMQQLIQNYFQYEDKVKKYFAAHYQFAHPQGQSNGQLMHISEKFGVLYLIMIKTQLKSLKGQVLSMVVNFTLNNIIKTKKYINSSRLIEECYAALQTALACFQEEESDIEMSVSLLDTNSLELEYSSTNFSIYHMSGEHLNELSGGIQNEETKHIKRFGLNNAYQVKKVNLKEGDLLLFTSLDLPPDFPISNWLNWKEKEKDDYLSQWVTHEQIDHDFLFTQFMI